MDENTIYIGSKPPMNYVLAIMRYLNVEGSDEVVLRARGQAISRAVDVAEIARRRFGPLQTSRIEIGSEQMQSLEGSTRGVSTIAITMKRESEEKARKEAETPHHELSDIKAVGGVRTDKLKNAGFKTVESISKAKPERLAELTGFSQKIG